MHEADLAKYQIILPLWANWSIPNKFFLSRPRKNLIGLILILRTNKFFRMTISENSVVSMHYTLTDNSGQVIDTSNGREPMVYLHGIGQLISGLEKELGGKAAGDKMEVTISPEDGYGPRMEQLVKKVPRANFPEGELQPGMQFQTETERGKMVFTLIEVGGDHVIVDGNHPLAGVVLNFSVEILDVRAATAQEIEDKVVHATGGNQ